MNKVSTERRERKIQILKRSEGTRLIRRGAKVLVEKNIGEERIIFIWISFLALLKIFEISPFASRRRTTQKKEMRIKSKTLRNPY